MENKESREVKIKITKRRGIVRTSRIRRVKVRTRSPGIVHVSAIKMDVVNQNPFDSGFKQLGDHPRGECILGRK